MLNTPEESAVSKFSLVLTDAVIAYLKIFFNLILKVCCCCRRQKIDIKLLSSSFENHCSDGL